jgi:branched-chain amino acid transport system ATP-binding protein
MSDILVARDLIKDFGRLRAVNELSFEVKKGEILGMMGPNGAGKTTVFNLLTGVYRPDGGSITFDGRNITNEPPPKRCRRGIGRTYQVPRPFGKMTVYENVLVGAVHGGRLSEKSARDGVHETLELVGLLPKKNQFAGSLPLLDRKRLELGRALATNPILLLIDEVAGGLTEVEVEQVLEIVKGAQKRGITIVWIEHILMMLSEGVERLLMIAEGQQLLSGDPKEVMASREVLDAYLGSEEDE